MMASTSSESGTVSTQCTDYSPPERDTEFDPVNDWDGLSLPPGDSGVWEHVYENGRRYHLYEYGRYPIPNDDPEQRREDLKHAMMMELTGNKLYLAPIGDNPRKIIDIGTGTGIWAIGIGDKFPNAQVLGTDLSPIQPEWIPENVRFMIDDCEADWVNGSDWDYAHFRQMAGIITKPDQVIQTTFDHLKPGGWIEFQELHVYPYCDDGTMKDDDPVAQIYDLFRQALELYDMNPDKMRALRGPLTRAGFTNIQLVKRKVPLGPWHKDSPGKRLIGQYLKTAVLDAIPSAMARLMPELGMKPVEQEVWMAKIKRSLNDNSIHRHFYFYFWYAQKPLQ